MLSVQVNLRRVTVSARGGRIVVSVPGRRGVSGYSGWTPHLAVVADGLRRVHRVVDYTGGTGTKPTVGLYVGSSGLVSDISDAVDIGAAGGVSSVAGRSGDVTLTKADVGLEAVDNTSDANKPVSIAQAAADATVAIAAAADASTKANAAQAAAIAAAATDATAKADAARTAAELTASTALSAHTSGADPHPVYQRISEKGQPNGYASLGGDGKIPAGLLPSIAIVDYLGPAASESAMLALVGQKGDWCVRTDTGMNWIITGDDPTQIENWTQLTYPASPVSSVAGRVGDVVLSKADVGLGNVDNTPDESKPVSTAQAAADTNVANAAATALSAHEAAEDPHPGYQLKTEKGLANGYPSLDASGKVPTGQLPAASLTNYQLFTTAGSHTWTNPSPLARRLGRARLIGGGPGGGSGRKGAPGTVRCGGGGGGAACINEFWFWTDILAATVAVTVGEGGAGGASVSADSTNGNAGLAGGLSYFGAWRAWPGNPGQGGTASSGVGGTTTGSGSLISGIVQSPATGASAPTNGGPGGGLTGNNQYVPTGAGAGGGITAANVPSSGGNGQQPGSLYTSGPGAPGYGGGVGTNGYQGGPPTNGTGFGGGGGGGSITGNAGNGANGNGPGAPGGGGGAATDGVGNSGAGGSGAPGSVEIIVFMSP